MISGLKKILFACLFSISLPIMAISQFGAYLEGNLGCSAVNFFDIYSTGTKLGSNVNGGYQFNSYLATELGLFVYEGGPIGIDLAVKGIIPLNIGKYGASLFGKIGATSLFDTKTSVTLPFLGAGASYTIKPGLDFTVQAQAASALFVNVGLLSIGLTYHF